MKYLSMLCALYIYACYQSSASLSAVEQSQAVNLWPFSATTDENLIQWLPSGPLLINENIVDSTGNQVWTNCSNREKLEIGECLVLEVR